MRKSALESGVKILLFDGWGTRHRPRGIYFKYTHIHCTYNILQGTKGGEFLALKHESRILGYSSNPVCCFSMTEQVRLCAVWPMENWLGSSFNHLQDWTTTRESYPRALEQGPLEGGRQGSLLARRPKDIVAFGRRRSRGFGI